ncbi:TIGR03759 family integrating conjugative element protein [Methylomonas albis]|uniref:TIGR03759 family integrating conjugative element protein n=1 Tax=Methylomonas albis TaxID=1854563 RepID=A0ABR9D2K9_9GAMM|nr:TIGR03759 family integrating conjugative element protein [Methylomonas albis]MBD9357349.1 TIGR03759 family integrating conjugative element protein [Methylomonas albis]
MVAKRLLRVVGFVAPLIAFQRPAQANESRTQPLTYTESQAQPVAEDTLRREQWSLSTDEWNRYKSLMQGIRGSISPASISPIEVLGTHARDDQERKRYAEIWARMRHEDAERILVFQQAYAEAFQRLYPNELLVDLRRLKFPGQQALDSGERLLVFLKSKHCPACESLVQRLLRQPAFQTQRIDLYFVDTQPQRDDGLIQQWAKQQHIDNDRIRQGLLTLNHDQGNYFKVTQQLVGTMPQVFKLKGQTLEALRL